MVFFSAACLNPRTFPREEKQLAELLEFLYHTWHEMVPGRSQLGHAKQTFMK